MPDDKPEVKLPDDTPTRLKLAEDENTAPEVLEKITMEEFSREDGDLNIIAALAGNPSTPPELLSQMLYLNTAKIRRALARNPSAPPDVLKTLATDRAQNIRVAVARNPNTPIALLIHLASRPDCAEAVAARKRILSQAPWSDDELAIAEGLVSETETKARDQYFPSLESLHDAIETYKSMSNGENIFNPNNALAIEAALILTESE